MKFTLLLHGIAISTNRRGESVLQKAITGMLTYEASVIGWWSQAGSVTTNKRGSRKAAYTTHFVSTYTLNLFLKINTLITNKYCHYYSNTGLSEFYRY